MTDEQPLLLTDALPFSDPPLTDEEAEALLAAARVREAAPGVEVTVG